MANNVDTCAECEKTIGRKEKTIECDGLCNKKVHEDCAQLTKEEVKCVNEHGNVFYICNKCIKYSQKEMKSSIDCILRMLREIKEQSNKSESELNEFKRDIGKSIDNISERLAYNDKERDNSKPKKSCDNATLINASTRNTVVKNNMKPTTMRQSLTRAQPTGRTLSTPTTSRIATPVTNSTTAVQQSAKNGVKKKDDNNVKNAPSNETVKNAPNKILIKPKQNTSIEKTLADLKSKFDPRNVKFSGIKKQKNGSIVIECTDKKECDEIKLKLEAELGNEYDIKIIRAPKPRVKIFGMSERIDEADMINLIKSQNEFLNNNDIEILKIVNDVKNDKIFNAIIQIDTDGFDKIMKAGKIGVNWDMCIVREHFSIMRCHNCSGFDHTKESCTKGTICGYCSEAHPSNECQATQLACISCMNANEKMGLSLVTNHHSWSRKCEILSKRIKKIGEKTDYGGNK